MKIYNRLFRGKIGSIWICGLVTTDSHGLTVTIPECDLSGILGISGINIFNAIEWYIGRTDKNGNKIYTGDIVRTKKGRIYKVVLRKYLSVTGYGFDPVDKKYATEAEPVKCGKWTEMRLSGGDIWDYYFVCGVCHGETPNRAFTIAPDYCPNCGAKMEE